MTTGSAQKQGASTGRPNGISKGYRRGQVHWRWNRLSGEIDPRNLDHPWLHFGAEGENWAWIAVGYGQTGADPAWFVELDLTGTRIGWLMCSIAYRWRCWRYRKASDGTDTATRGDPS